MLLSPELQSCEEAPSLSSQGTVPKPTSFAIEEALSWIQKKVPHFIPYEINRIWK